MSMKSWTEEGYGAPLLNGDNLEDVLRFVIDHSDLRYDTEKAEKLLACENEWDANDVLDKPLPWVVAEIINRLEGTTVFKGYQDDGDTNQEMMIGIAPAYPWQMTEKDRMTEEEATEILNKYLEEMGLDEIADYFDAEYCG
ncbi:MAG: hypothetical protein IKM88_16020 [Lachnospiraceae bacterium]|nr:hypothetical protein [Lachnospiraceae bacterium]MBR3734951.1 hypothetical protein [Lachnospiraceae bacterium]MBR6851730.1 hypothetical protein [Lachnospiraceae bacterium]